MATGICRAEVKSAAMHPTMHKAAYHTKDYLVPNVNNADCEKPCCKVKRYNAWKIRHISAFVELMSLVWRQI